MLRSELVKDQLDSASSTTASLKYCLVFQALNFGNFGDGVPIHLKSEFVHDIGYLSPPNINLSVHCLKLIRIPYVQTIELVAFVIVETFAVEPIFELKKGDPGNFNEGVQEGGIVEKVESWEEHSR